MSGGTAENPFFSNLSEQIDPAAVSCSAAGQSGVRHVHGQTLLELTVVEPRQFTSHQVYWTVMSAMTGLQPRLALGCLKLISLHIIISVLSSSFETFPHTEYWSVITCGRM